MNKKIKQTLHKIELKIVETIKTKIKVTDEQFYAGAFWLFYCDYTVIHPPCFALNTTSNLREQPEKWLPAEWEYDVVEEFTDALMPLYLELSNELENKEESVWEEVELFNFEMYCDICKKMTKRIHSKDKELSSWNITDKFIFYVHEEDSEFYEHYLELSIETMPKDLYDDVYKSPYKLYIQSLDEGATNLSKSDEIHYWVSVLDRVATGEEEKISEWAFAASDHAIEKLNGLGESAIEAKLRFVLSWADKPEFIGDTPELEEEEIKETSMSLPTFDAIRSLSDNNCATDIVKQYLLKILVITSEVNSDRNLCGLMPVIVARCIHKLFKEFPEPEQDEETNRLLNVKSYIPDVEV